MLGNQDTERIAKEVQAEYKRILKQKSSQGHGLCVVCCRRISDVKTGYKKKCTMDKKGQNERKKAQRMKIVV